MCSELSLSHSALVAASMNGDEESVEQVRRHTVTAVTKQCRSLLHYMVRQFGYLTTINPASVKGEQQQLIEVKSSLPNFRKSIGANCQCELFVLGKIN